MRALKLKLLPTQEQYNIFDEMFLKWASILNRYNRYINKKLDEKEIKKKLKPADSKNLQFSQTQVNQQAKTDNNDAIRAMKELGKQKQEEVDRLKERYNIIKGALSEAAKRDIDPQKQTRWRPKGWFKFHTQNHWGEEVEKLERQIKRKTATIKKIEKGRISFKPKRISLWSTSFKVNFKSKKILIKPFADSDNNLIVEVITEPLQPHRGSSLKSKKFLERGVKDFLIFASHKELFGLANDEEPLIKRQVNPFIVFNYSSEKIKVKENSKDEFRKKTLDVFKKWLGVSKDDELNRADIETIYQEIEKFWSSSIEELNKLKTQPLERTFNQDYIGLVKKSETQLIEAQKSLLKRKKESFNEKKLPRWKEDYATVLTEQNIKVLSDEVNKAFSGTAKDFLAHSYSTDYLKILESISAFQLEKDEFCEINKYPILFRKQTKRWKRITNLKSTEWDYYVQFGYEEINKPVIKTTRILGIDRGLKPHLLAYSVFEPESKKFVVNKLEQNPIFGWKWKFRKIKKSIQHMERRLRAQTGVHIPENQMKKRLKSLENKIENVYHNVSRMIVDLAEGKEASVDLAEGKNAPKNASEKASIVFEDLEKQGLKQHGRKKNARNKRFNYTLSLFDYGKIASLIDYKAKLKGIPVIKIDPAYTSQNCAKCVLEKGRFVDGITICYFEDMRIGQELNATILEEAGLITGKIIKIKKTGIEVEGKNLGENAVKVLIKKQTNRIVILDKDKYEIAEFQTRTENEKTAILDYIYKRGKEFKDGRLKYTGNKKVGYCTKHGQIDADLNAARVIALCLFFNINKPRPFEKR